MSRTVRRLLHTVVLAALIGVLLAVLTVAVFAEGVGEDDFVAYWSAARLLAMGENPYDPVALRDLQRQTRPDRGQEYGRAFASWNPPWLLAILLPFGLLPFDIAVHLWVLCNIGLIAAASVLTWQMLTGPSDRQSGPLVAAVSLGSAQALSVILLGQVVSLVLVGLVLGMVWLRGHRYKLAGAALFLTTIKPHVTYLALLLLLLWTIRHRRWGVVWGMLAAGALSMMIVSVVFPRWALAYLQLLSDHQPMLLQYATPTVGGLAHALWDTQLFRFAGLLLLPLAPSLVRLADSRGWLTAMNVTLLISVPLAVYGFGYDQVVLLPAMLQMVSWLRHGELPARMARAIGVGCVLVYAASFAMVIVSYRYGYWFVLIPVALAGLYALAYKVRAEIAGEAAPAGASSSGPKDQSRHG